MKPFIQKLRQYRKRLGINQTEFAGRLGVSLATITRWERANMIYTPDLRQISLMADMFDTTVVDLLAPETSKHVTTDEMVASALEGTPHEELENVVTPDEQAALMGTVTIDETSAEEELVNADEMVPSEEIPHEEPESIVTPDEQAAPMGTVTSDELQDEQDLITPEETISEVVNADEIDASVPDDAPHEEPESVVTPDEQAALMGTVTNDESQDEQELVINDETLNAQGAGSSGETTDQQEPGNLDESAINISEETLQDEITYPVAQAEQTSETETEINGNADITADSENDNSAEETGNATNEMLHKQLFMQVSHDEPEDTDIVNNDETLNGEKISENSEKMVKKETVTDDGGGENVEKMTEKEIDSPDFLGRPIITKQPKRKRLRRQQKEDEEK